MFEAADGHEAITMLSGREIDVVLADVTTPWSGFALRQIFVWHTFGAMGLSAVALLHPHWRRAESPRGFFNTVPLQAG